MQGSREGKVRLSTHTFAGMANALTRKEPPHDDQPELMTRAERRRAARKARAAKTWKKVAAGTVAVATLFGGMGVASTALAADRDSYQDTIGNSSFEAARNQYGLAKHMKNGAILHAWMWSFKTITQHMPEIAAAGYTSVQTEPMSKIKEVAANGKKFTENWYYVYQPANTSIGNFVVGTEADLKEMTATAHKYGVRVIVDVVANHFTSDWNAIDPDWQNKDYFHKRTGCDGPNGEINDYSNRYKVTQCHLLGLWDLNTQNQAVADRMQKFLKTAVADGVDGFRYDAAKHVELPTEVFDNKQSNYWNTILKNGSQFQYGEVLQGDSGLDYKAYANMFRDNSSDGGGNTASNYGKTIRAAVGSNNLDVKMVKNIDTGGASEDQLVTWVESHDNYANGDKESTGLTDYQIMMGWAVVGSRRAGAPLYFNRPKGSGGTNPQFAEQSQLGDAGDDMWKNKSVAAVNHFRNAMDGKGENLQNCGDKSCLMIERSTSDGIQNDGVVIANMGGDKSLSGMETTLDDGTYPDEVNGGQLVVSNHKIVSGTAKGGAVSVFYVKGESDPNVSVEAASKEFSSDNVKVTLRAQDADNLKYTTTEGESGSFTDGNVISVGKTLSIGETATVKVTGTAAKDGKKVKKGQALSASVTVKKVEVPKQNLAAQYSTNKVGMGVKKTINFNAGKDASIADWDSSMLIAQGAANDDPRVYRPNSMYEVPIDLYALYGAYDDDNLYLMWEMTNVQDVVDTGDDYPLSQGHLWQTQNLPFHIAIDTKDDSTCIGNNGGLQTGGSLWASNITWGGEQKLNNVVTISTNGSNGPWIYKGDESGLNSKAAYGPAANAATNTKKSNIKFGYGNGILSKDVIGIDGGWGENNGRFIGDMKAENQNKAKWVNFNEKGHNSAQMDDHYEIAIPLEEIGTMTADNGKIAVGDFHPNGEFVNGNNGTAEEHAVFNRPLGFSFDVRDTFAVPDVSRNAEMLNASWQRSQYACNIDGLISVDPVFIQKMVEINGPVTLSNGTVLTGENTAEYMLNTIYKDVPVAQQDEYFEYIAKTVMDGAFGNMTVDKMMKVAQSIGDLAENRHFYAYTFHDDEAKYFQGAGLAKNAPESETNPETGIYISEQNPSKMGWYIDRTSEVTKTGDKTYHVKYTLTNRMTSTEMATCTSYILGGEQKGVGGVPVAPSGTSAQRVLIYAPAGGSIGSIAVTGDVRDRSNATMDGKPLNSSMAYIAPGKSVTYEFDVTVSDKATADMKLDQTPCGKMTNDVKYNY